MRILSKEKGRVEIQSPLVTVYLGKKKNPPWSILRRRKCINTRIYIKQNSGKTFFLKILFDKYHHLQQQKKNDKKNTAF